MMIKNLGAKDEEQGYREMEGGEINIGLKAFPSRKFITTKGGKGG
jgi:hypothetical protein